MEALTRHMENCWREVGVAREEASGQALLHEARQVVALGARVDALERAAHAEPCGGRELRAALGTRSRRICTARREPPLLRRLAASEAAISRQEMHLASPAPVAALQAP